jgi:Zn-dependent protease with chaperone function
VSAMPRGTLRISGEVALLAVAAIAFPVVFALAIALAGVIVAFTVGHFAAFLLKLLWILLFPLFAALRGLWSTPQTRDGEPLIAGHAPELFALIDRLRAAASAARIHAVYLTSSVNASMTQIPRYGVFGGTRNELHLGVPLMTAMDVEHFTAVLAHEIGHLARRHGSFRARIYAMRNTLDVMVVALERHRSPLVYLVAWFYRRFIPLFERATLELSRAVEFEADSAAADAVGAHVAAEALVVVHGIQSYCHAEVWPAIFKRVSDDPEPPVDVYGAIAEQFRRPITDGHRFVATALAAATDADGTHPALIDRVRRLGCEPAALEFALDRYAVGDSSAADVYLGGAGAQRSALANEWRRGVRVEWEGLHAELAQLTRRLHELDRLGQEASPEQLRERALAAARLERSDAIDLLTRASDALPQDADLALRAGGELALDDRAESLPYLERAVSANPATALVAWTLARGYFARRNDETRVADYDARIAARQADLTAADAERAVFSGAEAVEPHGLDDRELAPLRTALDLADIRAAFFARRVLTHVPEIPHFVLAVARNKSKYGTSDENIATIVRNDLESFPYGVTVVVSSKSGNRAVEALRAVEGTELRL